MIRHHVEQQPHAVFAQRRRQRVEISFCAHLGVKPPIVHNVVAVSAAAARPEQRRRIHIGDAEIVQVGHKIERVAQRKAGVELKPIRRAGDAPLRQRIGDHGLDFGAVDRKRHHDSCQALLA